jgi:hypothetical protein
MKVACSFRSNPHRRPRGNFSASAPWWRRSWRILLTVVSGGDRTKPSFEGLSTDRQSSRWWASGAKTDRAELRKVMKRLDEGDVLLVTRLDRLARSTRDLLNTMHEIAERGAGFRSLADTWADTTTPHGRLMLTVLGGLAEFERELIKARTSVVIPTLVSHVRLY